ncbi:heavy metal translocating P-type ATPase [Pseudomonas sp. HR96]|uniref:heavy metal translocating P-type ATPase n=1 Tax=Pseudomonas sp. HR96 TaxID=1027966 RepID=UPI002A754E12|nr:heavy metal translocating P-type ATPase [Pseudomonas sp. HR96]WPP00516.1 heavy metal translocating P-type ATPase [Pseudomonas sp. HR96]
MSDLPTLELSVSGMTCANCAGRVERALKKLPAVEQASVNLASHRAQVTLRSAAPAALLIAAIERAGYQASLGQNPDDQCRAAGHERLAVVLALLLALPLLAPMLLQPMGVHWMLPAWLQCLLAGAVQFGIGARFYRAAWRALRTLDGNMDLLVVLGTSAGYGLSVYLWLSSPAAPMHLYFESSSTVIALVLLGKWLEGRARRQAGQALRALENLQSDTALRQVGERLETVAVQALRPDDVLLVKPGARFACDGIVLEGRSHADEALISGEPLPVAKQPGDRVTGGAINGEGQLRVRVTALGPQSTLARIIRLVESAQGAKAPIQLLVDRVSRVFVPLVLVIALLTLLGWLLGGAPVQTAIIHAVAVLVIACPCALGLATPAAVLAGTGAAARHGILIKDSTTLQRAEAVDCVVFDKTGTLTLGRPRLLHQAASNGDEQTLLRLAAALQQGSEHPLALALLERCGDLPALHDSRALAGRGIAGTVEGQPLQLGNRRLLEDLHLSADAISLAWEAEGCTVSWLVAMQPQAHVLGVLAFADEARPQARAAVALLQADGVVCHLLTGDNLGSARQIATAVAIHQVHAQVLPAGKAQVIETLRRTQVVAMVGDGINDAPALAAADLGLAMASGTDVAMQAAGITLMRSDPRLVAAALDICRRTQAKIRQNLFWAFIYNLLGIPLAAAGWLSPVLAGTAMALSSVSVVLNALWLTRWRPGFSSRGQP